MIITNSGHCRCNGANAIDLRSCSIDGSMLALNMRSDIDLQTEIKIHGVDDQSVDDHGVDKD